MIKIIFGQIIEYKLTEQHNNVVDVDEETKKIILQSFMPDFPMQELKKYQDQEKQKFIK